LVRGVGGGGVGAPGPNSQHVLKTGAKQILASPPRAPPRLKLGIGSWLLSKLSTVPENVWCPGMQFVFTYYLLCRGKFQVWQLQEAAQNTSIRPPDYPSAHFPGCVCCVRGPGVFQVQRSRLTMQARPKFGLE